MIGFFNRFVLFELLLKHTRKWQPKRIIVLTLHNRQALSHNRKATHAISTISTNFSAEVL